MKLPGKLYRQFDADYSRDVPGEGYGGWHELEVELAPAHTALVVMHAWDSGKPGEFPGWRRAVEYTPRAEKILAEVFPPLLKAVRSSPLPVFHVVGGRDYYSHLPGFMPAAVSPFQQVAPDPVYHALQKIRHDHSTPGAHNATDANAGFAQLNFAPNALPVNHEGIAENGDQLAALCRARNINHLVYVGFAINWCLLMSPGGMVDMKRHGCICSTIAEAVTAVENRETAREEREKKQALWRVAVEFGFVFKLADFLNSLKPSLG